MYVALPDHEKSLTLTSTSISQATPIQVTYIEVTYGFLIQFKQLCSD